MNIEVTQADRDAAALIMISREAEDAVRRGVADSNPVVQAFAAHRAAHAVSDHRIDMANVGEALMEAIRDYSPDPFMKNWRPADCPSEIVGDLLNALDEQAIYSKQAYADGMTAAADICGSLAETTYDDADGFRAATGCEAAIMNVVRKRTRRDIMMRALLLILKIALLFFAGCGIASVVFDRYPGNPMSPLEALGNLVILGLCALPLVTPTNPESYLHHG